MIRISIPFLFMIYDSSTNHISDFCIDSYFRIFHIFTNLLYTKNLTNLTNLTTLQILQPYNLFVDECRTMCRHILYNSLMPASPRRRVTRSVEIRARCVADTPVCSQSGSPRRCVPARQHHLPPTQQSLNHKTRRSPGSQLRAPRAFIFTRQVAGLPLGR